MFYFDNTLIIRHIVLIALLLAMGPALHNPESIVENLGFSTQLRFKRSSATLQPYESLEAYELRRVAGSTSRSISTSRFPDRGGFPGGVNRYMFRVNRNMFLVHRSMFLVNQYIFRVNRNMFLVN